MRPKNLAELSMLIGQLFRVNYTYMSVGAMSENHYDCIV